MANNTLSNKEKLQLAVDEQKNISNYIYTSAEMEKSALENILRHRLNEEKQEKHFQRSFIEAREEAEQKRMQAIREQQMTEELHRDENRRIREEKMRQNIRETNHELLELERKLRAAYVGKAIKAQLDEKEIQRLQEKLSIQKEQNRANEKRLAMEEENRQAKLNARTEKLKFREKLLDQIKIKKQRKQMLYEEFLKEKKFIDRLIKKVHEEKLQDLEIKLKKKLNFRAGLDEFRKAQEIWQEKERREIEEENQRLMEYLREKELKLQQISNDEEERRKNADMLVDKMCEELLDIQVKARQREDLLILLKEEEVQEQCDLKERAELEEKLRKRVETRLQLEIQKQERIIRNEEHQNREREFRLEQLRILAEKDKIEQLTVEKKRQKLAEHHRIIREIIENRKQQKEHDIVTLVKDHQNELEEQQRMQQIIEEERIKILKEHAAELFGFLPPGVLRETDRSILNL